MTRPEPEPMPMPMPVDVVGAHLHAVDSGDPEAMALHYHDGAVLERPDASYRGRTAIAAYFLTVPDRLAGGVVTFDHVAQDDRGGVTVAWHLSGGPGNGTAGVDTYTVEDGLIVRQVVALATADF